MEHGMKNQIQRYLVNFIDINIFIVEFAKLNDSIF
jgi:hypothetical protein